MFNGTVKKHSLFWLVIKNIYKKIKNSRSKINKTFYYELYLWKINHVTRQFSSQKLYKLDNFQDGFIFRELNR